MSCTIDASASAGGLMPTAATPPSGSMTPQFAPTTPTATAVAGASGGAVSSLGGGGTAVAGAAAAIGGGAIAPILQELSAAIAALTAAIQPTGTVPVTGGGASGCGCSGMAGGGGAAGAPGGAAGAPTAVQEQPAKHRSDGGGGGGGGNADTPKPDAAPPAAAAGGGGTADAGRWLTGDLEGLDAELTKRLATLGERLGEKLTIVSGNRTFEEQTVLYNKYKAGTGNLAAKPGTSNHEGGDAADVNVNGTSLANNAKAKQLAAELGLHFPVPGEPWHVEVK